MNEHLQNAESVSGTIAIVEARLSRKLQDFFERACFDQSIRKLMYLMSAIIRTCFKSSLELLKLRESLSSHLAY